MSRNPPKCPACSLEMEKGAIVDRGHGNQEQPSRWVEGGETNQGRFLGIEWTSLKTSGKTIRTIESYRCPKCGFLANFAP